MSDQQYYRILLDDYSAASFTSFDKAYFGTMSDLEGWIKAIEVEKCFAERFSSLTKTFRAYQSGQHNITHNVAYQEVRFLDKVTLLYRESYTAEKLAWEHLNTWQWPYFMSCEKVESEHLWLRCKDRCFMAKFYSLKYGTDPNEQTPAGGMLWGFPEMLEVDDLPLMWNRLAEPEKNFKTLAEAQADWKPSEPPQTLTSANSATIYLEMAELTDARRDVNEADINVREEAVKAMDRTRLQDFRKLLNNLFESGKCYRIEEAMEHINFAKAEISLWMIIDEVPDGRIKKCTQLSMITIEARHLLLQKK